MKFLLLSLSLLLPVVVFSQLDTFVTSDITSFELNTSGKKNVHYIFLNPENKIKVMEGNFIENKKDGLWLYYDRDNNKIIHSQNSYKLGIKDGIWIERYLNSEQIERKEEYADGKLLSGHYFKENGNYSAPYNATSLSAFRTFCPALIVVSMTDLSTAKQSAP